MLVKQCISPPMAAMAKKAELAVLFAATVGRATQALDEAHQAWREQSWGKSQANPTFSGCYNAQYRRMRCGKRLC